MLVEFYPGSISPPAPANNNDKNNGKKKRKKNKKKNKGNNGDDNATSEESTPQANNPEQTENKNSPNLFFLSTLDGDLPSGNKKTHFSVTSIESGLTLKEHTVPQSWYLDQYPVKSAGFCIIESPWEIYWRKNQINFWDMANEKEYMAMDTVR